MKLSIIPEIINSKKIIFFDEKNRKVFLCKDSGFKYIPQFKEPFIIIDTFAKKTTSTEDISIIDIDELKKLGYNLTSTRAGNNRWFKRQLVIYRIESSSNISPGSKRLKEIPSGHSVEKDSANNKIRLVGPNAGYPRVGNGGPWTLL